MEETKIYHGKMLDEKKKRTLVEMIIENVLGICYNGIKSHIKNEASASCN